ncbi:putative alpha-l-rhamnosidase protein [Neofusicoccum parvum UCRNP2]|uniref:Putative alpha-l-rhamnosidase protein n=1 Tax=Botryosphaeria parva (strain UCR-NP2) TaxID=1287680 RepID=R1GTK6_BOTPV|nr:putative alpha-l-rhamnosidase protein [Neofusicoccum parvum UCRNP2]
MAPGIPTSAGVLLTALATAAALTTTDVYPKQHSLGNASIASNFTSSTCVTLTASNPVVTLDYVNEIGGFPFIEVSDTSASGVQIESSNYTLRFSTKIVRGGTGWRIATGLKGYGQYIVLTSEYPEGTFLNTNRTLLPPNSLVTNFGWSIVNQTTLITGPTIQYSVPFAVKEGEWYEVSTTINTNGYAVSINGSDPIFVSNEYSLNDWASTRGGSGDKTSGTWGFGPFQDQEAYVTDVVVEAPNGTILYQNDLTDASVVEEYGVADNTHNVCLDGAKRDRLVWTGDYAHTQRIIGASTNSSEFSTGTLSYALDWQAPAGSSYAGFSGMSAAMGASTKYGTDSAGYALIDYQFLFLVAFADYYQFTGDLAFLASHWSQLKTLVSALLLLVDSSSNLVTPGSIPGAFFLGDPNGTAPSALFVHALQRASTLATAANDTASAASWSATASTVASAINDRLWNQDLGTYASSLADFGNSSLAGTAFAILSGAAPPARTAAAIAALADLRLGIGYKADSGVATAAAETSLSPNLSGFLLEALLKASADAAFATNGTTASPATASASEAAGVLLDGLWAAMVADDAYATGSSWEYVYGDGRPGLDTYTSHAHPWGGAPTYVLSEGVWS